MTSALRLSQSKTNGQYRAFAAPTPPRPPGIDMEAPSQPMAS